MVAYDKVIVSKLHVDEAESDYIDDHGPVIGRAKDTGYATQTHPYSAQSRARRKGRGSPVIAGSATATTATFASHFID